MGIGKFVEKDVTDRPISKHLQKSYIFKVDDGRPEIINQSSDFPVKTLVASYHKIQRLTGTFVADGPTGLRLLTAKECKAIMGFPKSFKIPVSRIPIKLPPKGKCIKIKANVFSHKLGWATGPLLYDAAGKVIKDPRRANRNYGYNYTKYCSSFCVKNKGIDVDSKIRNNLIKFF